MRFSLYLTGIAALALNACASQGNIVDTGQYWQRASVSEAAYAQGPKAQQMLNQDIASCVAELRELERLGQLRNAIPANSFNGKVLNSDEEALADWDQPDRVKYLLSEHGNYHDFETCMIANGWERVKHVPYDVAHNSRKNYMKNNVNYEYMPNLNDNDAGGSQTQEGGAYSNLNN